MPLLLLDGTPFATGSAPYDYRPVTSRETAERIIVQIEVEGIMTQAAIDTGLRIDTLNRKLLENQWQKV